MRASRNSPAHSLTRYGQGRRVPDEAVSACLAPRARWRRGRLGPNAAEVPLVGRIAAGVPILAEEMIEDTFWLPRTLVGNGTLFMLAVAGDSMAAAGISDGDLVVVRRQPVAENGEIVAAAVTDGSEPRPQ